MVSSPRSLELEIRSEGVAAETMRGLARILKSRRVYQGRVLDVRVDCVIEPGDERISARLFTRRELIRMLRGKRIRDGKTLVGLLWLLSRIPFRQAINRKAK